MLLEVLPHLEELVRELRANNGRLVPVKSRHARRCAAVGPDQSDLARQSACRSMSRERYGAANRLLQLLNS
jgi:hypothetical protein